MAIRPHRSKWLEGFDATETARILPDAGVMLQKIVFPVGFILITGQNINPATTLGYGTWVLVGQGLPINGAPP